MYLSSNDVNETAICCPDESTNGSTVRNSSNSSQTLMEFRSIDEIKILQSTNNKIVDDDQESFDSPRRECSANDRNDQFWSDVNEVTLRNNQFSPSITTIDHLRDDGEETSLIDGSSIEIFSSHSSLIDVKKKISATTKFDDQLLMSFESSTSENDDNDYVDLLETLSKIHQTIPPISLVERKSSSLKRFSSSSASHVDKNEREVNEEQKKNDEKKTSLFHPILSDDSFGVKNVKQKEKYQRKEEKPTKRHFTAVTESNATSSILLNTVDESSLTKADRDKFLSIKFPRREQSEESTNQLEIDHWQTEKTKSNMETERAENQTISDLFDPFSPTTTRSDDHFHRTMISFDDRPEIDFFFNFKPNSESNENLSNYLKWLFDHFQPKEKSSDEQIQSLAEILVSKTLRDALDQLDPPSSQVEIFVERILADALLEIFHEDEEKEKIVFSQNDEDPFNLMTEYVPNSLLNNDPERMVNNLMKYSLGAPVFYENVDDTSFSEDLIPSEKKEPIITEETLNESKNLYEKTTHNDSADCIFSSNAELSAFDVFASDEPLAEMKNEFDEKFISTSINDESPWICSIEKSPKNVDNEPWELDELVEPKKSSNINENFFDDSFDPPGKEISNENFSKTTIEEISLKIIQTESNEENLRENTKTENVQTVDSAILQTTSNENDVLICFIDNTPVTIDGKTIAPFRDVIRSAGKLQRDNQTAVIALYGCSLPDHRLREYRYIMDQLFYYVYHELERLVTNDYVLVYFHGATPKHRTPDLKFLRKCYQMINFRLRKNLRAVHVVHPTRWLRTIIALSRPFFSKKFYYKINYLYTINDLEREFPNNELKIPEIIEQTDGGNSTKNRSTNSSLRQSIGKNLGNREGESVA